MRNDLLLKNVKCSPLCPLAFYCKLKKNVSDCVSLQWTAFEFYSLFFNRFRDS